MTTAIDNLSVSHEELIATDGTIPPGVGYVELHFPLGGKTFAFRAMSAERVEGIDYSAFKIYSVWVGSKCQWHGRGDELWPATDLFERWDVPMDVVQTGLSIGIHLRNESENPQKFAVKLVGRVLR